MKDPFDEAELEIQQLIKEHDDIEAQMAELDKLVRKYQSTALAAKERGDAETLSNTIIRLSRVNSALGNRASYAKYVARNADRAYRRLRDTKKLDYINEKNAIGKAESMAYIDKTVDDAFHIYSQVQLLADTADDLAYKTDTFIKMCQSGLSLIKQDIRG